MLTAVAIWSVIAKARTTSITFVRHAETVANATGKYNSKTLNALSEKGLKQSNEVVSKLLKLGKFDAILCSPSERVLKTFAPYLKASKQIATIWPLLYECCTGKRSPIAKGPLKFGAKITVPSQFASTYSIDPAHDRLPVAPQYSMGLVQMKETLREFYSRYQGKKLLILGHSGHGGQFIHALTGKWKKVENAQPIMFTVPVRLR